jgi:hypothetical protein
MVMSPEAVVGEVTVTDIHVTHNWYSVRIWPSPARTPRCRSTLPEQAGVLVRDQVIGADFGPLSYSGAAAVLPRLSECVNVGGDGCRLVVRHE